jgi:hypothetical protein
MDIWPARTEGHLTMFFARTLGGEFDQIFFEKSNSRGFARGDDRSWN